MNKDALDKELIKIIKHDPLMAPEKIAQLLKISVQDVRERIERLSDTRQMVLIVDDELDTLTALKLALEAEKYNVIEASSGKLAIDMARSGHPDIILLDLMMPGMDGIEVCRILKEDPLTSHIPVIMLTARGDISDKIEGIETGADDYVTKPFNLDELKARIKMIIRRSTI